MNTAKFAAIVVTPEGQRVRLLPRTRKTSLFASEKKAIAAMDSFSKKLAVNGYRGLLYTAPYSPESKPTWAMAL